MITTEDGDGGVTIDLHPPAAPAPARFDWATFALGAIAGLLVAAMGLLIGAACRCPPSWIP